MPVGVAVSYIPGPPLIIMLFLLAISNIAGAGFCIFPCENVISPPPTETGVVMICFNLNNPKLSNAVPVPIISTKVSIEPASCKCISSFVTPCNLFSAEIKFSNDLFMNDLASSDMEIFLTQFSKLLFNSFTLCVVLSS